MASTSDSARLRLVRTSGFRLALQGAFISLCGALIVFVVVYHATRATVRNALDTTIGNEQSEILSRARLNDIPVGEIRPALVRSVEIATTRSKGSFYALISAEGQLLAGNLAMPSRLAHSWRGKRTLRRKDGIALPPFVTAIRGEATPLVNGDTLFVAENASSYDALKALIGRVFLMIFGPVLILGVIGGLLVARATQRRVLLVVNITRDIINGDLSRRLPLRGTGDEFDELSVVLNAVLDRIEALVENIRQVSNDIAHDLRSPLARLRERLELSRRNMDQIVLPELLEDSIRRVDAALKLFTAMLRISEVEAGARREFFTVIDLSALLLDLAETYDAVAEPDAKKLIPLIAPGLRIDGDPELIAQLFVNLIENAIRHCPAGTVIVVRAEARPKGRIAVIIADNGPGIPVSQRERVFQRFVRLDSARQSPGSGLGLALVAAIVGLHGYAIRLDDSRPGLMVVLDLAAASLAA